MYIFLYRKTFLEVLVIFILLNGGESEGNQTLAKNPISFLLGPNRETPTKRRRKEIIPSLLFIYSDVSAYFVGDAVA